MQTDSEAAHDEVVEKLCAIVGPERVKLDSVDLLRYRPGPWGYTDADHVFGWTPLLAVSPRTGDDVAACLSVISRAGFPIVPVTGGTGLTGGSLATANSIIVDLADMDEIITIDRQSRRATVSANIRIESMQDAARAANLLFAHDPWSAPLATVAGTISTNSVGYLAAGYGTMGNQVLGLRVALTTGVLLDLTRRPATTAGPDIASLFIGSEGTLGVIVEATVRLYPIPEQERLIGIGFNRFEDAFRALNATIDARLSLAMVDLQEPDDVSGRSEMMICLHGSSAVIEQTIQKLTAIALDWNGHVLPKEDVQTFWRERHAATDTFSLERKSLWSRAVPKGGRTPRVSDTEGSRYIHVCLPAGQVLEYRRWVIDVAGAAGLACREFGIWGIPEFFSFILSGPYATTDSIADEMILEAGRRGGSIEYCHGIGLTRAHLMPAALGESWNVLQELKKVLDPSGMLNPGKQGLDRRIGA